MRQVFAILREYFKEKPSLEDYIAAHNPSTISEVEYLQREYARFMVDKNFWGTKL
jgi:hypothetical protein